MGTSESAVPSVRGRYLIALLSGGMLAFAFPRTELAGAAWLAPALILWAAAGTPKGTSFRVGYLAGLAFFLISLYWMLFIPFPAGAFAGWLSLSAYCALYPGVWVWLSWQWIPSRPSPETPAPLSDVARSLSQAGWTRRQLWALQITLLWVALEMGRGILLTGFPFNFIAISQFRLLPFIQIADITGVYGVSFLIVHFSVSLSLAVAVWLTSQRSYKSWSKEMAPTLLLLAACLTYGVNRITSYQAPSKTLKTALVQPSIPQTLIWDSDKNAARFQKLLRLSKDALESDPDLLIWPEAALPGLRQEDYQKIIDLIRRHQVWMVLGADDVETYYSPRQRKPEQRYYNAGFLVGPNGRVAEVYRKQHLVIFGEYIPLADQLPFLTYLSPIQSNFSSGQGPVAFDLPESNAHFTVLICFEDLFPKLARNAVRPNTDFLLNLTNDGWFGESAAQWQHAANAVFRAVENRRSLVRCTNNGLTCWVDPRGALRAADFPSNNGRPSVYAAGTQTFDIPIRPDQSYTRTFYSRQGDWLPLACVAFSLVRLLWPWLTRRENRRTGHETTSM